MYKRQLILLLCLLFLGGSLSASKTAGGHGLRSSKRGGSGGFHRSNYMSGDPNRDPPDGDFYIDEAQSATYEGSADQDDEDTGASGTDDEDDENETEGSAVMPHETHCLKMRNEMERDGFEPGTNIPRCTESGEYEVIQCSLKTGECWCVNYYGVEILDTIKRKPENPDCKHVDRNKKISGPLRRPGAKQPNSEPTHSTETSSEEIIIETPREKDTSETKNDKEPDMGSVEIKTLAPETDPDFQESKRTNIQRTALVAQPGILAGIIGGAVVGLLCAVLLVMFIVYRMRKKDEGSYALDEPKRSPSLTYTKARDKEFFA